MTLNTEVFVRDSVDPLAVFQKCRTLLGATTETEARFWFREDGVWSIGNKIAQGLPALLAVECRPGEPLRTVEQAAAHEDWCDDDCDGSDHAPACWLEVSFDTAYSWQDEQGGCGHLHARLVAELGRWLDEQGPLSWLWQNEFTGEFHERYDGLTDLAGGGDAAREWFTTTVAPAIAAATGAQVDV